MCILDLSKVLMYEFYSDYSKNKYINKSRLLLMYEIKTEDVYEDFNKDEKMFLSLVLIHLSRNIMIIQTNKLLVKQMI